MGVVGRDCTVTFAFALSPFPWLNRLGITERPQPLPILASSRFDSDQCLISQVPSVRPRGALPDHRTIDVFTFGEHARHDTIIAISIGLLQRNGLAEYEL